MKTIDLQKIIKSQNLEVKEIAKQLFPSNKYPKLALDRVIAGDAFLDTNQVSKLSLLTGIPIEMLYSGSEWKISGKAQILKFTTEEYTAELDMKNWTTKLFHNHSLFHEAIIHDGCIALNEYLSKLTELITNFKNNEHIKS